MNTKQTILIVAGEASGDMHGSALLKQLRLQNPNAHFLGIGGDTMIAKGFEAIYHINQMAFLGFFEVVKHLPFILSVRKHLLSLVEKYSITTVVLIDYPGFNLSLARKLKSYNCKVIYYISPQLWAWGQHRVQKVKKYVNTMLVIFPFEKEFYSSYGVHAEFVGHPLVERFHNYTYISRAEFLSKFGLKSDDKFMLLLPGSRKHEIEEHLGVMIETAQRVSLKHGLKIVIAQAPTISDELLQSAQNLGFVFVNEHIYDAMKYAEVGLIKSGTSTVEVALSELPMAVLYKTGAITYFIGKLLIQVTSIAMVNIIAEKQVVKEFIQHEANPEALEKELTTILTDNNYRKEILSGYEIIKQKLGDLHPAETSAQIITTIIKQNE